MPNPISLPIFYGGAPREGARFVNLEITPAILFALDNASNAAIETETFDFSASGMASVQSATIDNSLNGASVFFRVQDTGQTFRVPAFAVKTVPIFTGQLTFVFQVWTIYPAQGVDPTGADPSAFPVGLRLYNFAQAPSCETLIGTVNSVASGADKNVLPIRGPGVAATVVPPNAWSQLNIGVKTRLSRWVAASSPGFPAATTWALGFSDNVSEILSPPTHSSYVFAGPGFYEARAGYAEEALTSSIIWVFSFATTNQPFTWTWWGP